MNIHIYLGCFLGLFQVSVDILGRSRVSTVTQQQFFEKTFTSLSLEKKKKIKQIKKKKKKKELNPPFSCACVFCDWLRDPALPEA